MDWRKKRACKVEQGELRKRFMQSWNEKFEEDERAHLNLTREGVGVSSSWKEEGGALFRGSKTAVPVILCSES